MIDASVAVRWFLESEADEASQAILERSLAEPDLFAVPELFFFEVLAVLCRVHPNPFVAYCDGLLPAMEAGILRYPMTESVARGVEKFGRLGLTGYDAAYASLAVELGATWITYDARAHERIQAENVSLCLQQGLPAGWSRA